MELVKSLQHRKEEVSKRRSKLQLALASAKQVTDMKLKKIILKDSSKVATNKQQHSCQANIDETGSPSISFNNLQNVKSDIIPRKCETITTGTASISKELRDCVQGFQVHSESLSETLVIEIICTPIPSFHSSLLGALESFALAVTCCSITRINNSLICIVTVKVWIYVLQPANFYIFKNMFVRGFLQDLICAWPVKTDLCAFCIWYSSTAVAASRVSPKAIIIKHNTSSEGSIPDILAWHHHHHH